MKKPIRPAHGKTNNYERVLDRNHDIINGGISNGGTPNVGGFVPGIHTIPGNTDTAHVNVAAPAGANTEFAVTHNLNRIPVGYRVAARNNAGNVYNSTTAWTVSQIFLKCDTSGTQFTLEIY